MDSKASNVATAEWRCSRCSKCRLIPWDLDDWRARGLEFKIQHHDSFAALEDAAALGCRLCRNIRVRALIRAKESSLKSDACFLYFLRHGKSSANFFVQFSFGGDHLIKLETRAADVCGVSTTPMNSIRRFASETVQADLEFLLRERIQPWLNDCLGQRGFHTECAQHRFEGEEKTIPTRLIYVGNGQKDPVRLFETKDLLQHPKPAYLALSYSWGQSNEPAKTTRASLQARKKSLEISSLPRTVQDAINLTRLMGIRYLWVDAVCIIQPDQADKYLTDWEREAPKMATYYSNAHCLISALSASDSSQGIFTERKVPRYVLENCAIAHDPVRNTLISVCSDTVMPGSEFDKQPLLNRGWYLQERLSSPRTIHWSSNCLFWECRSKSGASEIDPDDEMSARDTVYTQSWDAYVRDYSQIFRQPADVAMGSTWPKFVSYYASAKFTYQTDRLIAVQSLGARLAAQHGVEYFAGVFGSHLAEGLLWFDWRSGQGREKLPQFPTWSWASYVSDGRLEFPSPGKSLVRCRSHGVFPPERSWTDFGTPEKRTLRLMAPLLTVGSGPVEYKSCHVTVTDEPLDLKFDLFFDGRILLPSLQNRLQVLLLSFPETSSGFKGLGLVVRPEGQYHERIGYAQLSSPLLKWTDEMSTNMRTTMENRRKEDIVLI